MQLQQQIDKALFRAKRLLLIEDEFKFIGYIVSGLKINITLDIPTACVTSDLDLYVNPDFFLSLPPAQQKFLLAHEACHVVYDHFSRLDTRDPKKWNVAGDYLINSYLISKGMEFIPDGCYNTIFDTPEWTTEKIYQYLNDHPDLIPKGFNNDIKLSNNHTGKGSKDLSKVSDLISNAANAAKREGSSSSIPEAISLALQARTKPTVDWSILLRKYLTAQSDADYTWSKPNRRYITSGFYFPSAMSEDLAKITVAIDTSASVSIDMLTKFVSDIHGIYSRYNPEALEVLQFSDSITSRDNIKNSNDFSNIVLKGGGGTCVKEVLSEYAKSRSSVLLVITDGYFSISKEDYIRKDIIWIIYDNPSCTMPFGSTSHITL